MLNTVCKENQCAGCMACVDVCPTHSIIIRDNLAYMNAEINEETCIHCGLCHKVCQVNHPAKLTKPMSWHQGWAEKDIRSTSSSGGFCQEMVHFFIKTGGAVAACKLDRGEFKFFLVDNFKMLKGFFGSKYVKSNPEGIYKQVRAKLKAGSKVLFIGLPCQVSAMKNFIPEVLQSQLYTIDLICHGSPSVKLLAKSLQEYGYDLKQIQDILFRRNNRFGLESVKQITPEGVMDRYTLAFLRGLTYTENCYHCHYAQLDRVGDITVGDSWGTEYQQEENEGVSLVLCQTEKGKELLQQMDFKFLEVDLANAVKNNQQLNHPSAKPAQRDEFFANLQKGMEFNTAVAHAYPKVCMKQSLKKILLKLGIYQKIRGGTE